MIAPESIGVTHLGRHGDRVVVAGIASHGRRTAIFDDHGIDAQVNGTKRSTHAKEQHVVEWAERREEPDQHGTDHHERAHHERHALAADLEGDVGDRHVRDETTRNGDDVDNRVGSSLHGEEIRGVARDVGRHRVI